MTWKPAFLDADCESFTESFVGATAEVKLRAVSMLAVSGGGGRLFVCVYASSEWARVGSNRAEVGTCLSE